MSVVLRSIEAFPRGRTTAELNSLLSSEFDVEYRAQLLAKLDELLDKGLVQKDRAGRWYSRRSAAPSSTGPADIQRQTASVITVIHLWGDQ